MAKTVPAVYYRGGSSKAVFFHEEDIPKPGPARDAFIKRLMGTPDPIQIDGMGGSRIITSKVAIIRKSDRTDADVDYTFAQVGIEDDTIGCNGNCGNISAAVGPFALTEGLVETKQQGVSIAEGMNTRIVRIYNTGTRKVLVSHVPIDESSGEVLETGDFAIAAVPGTGAPILMDYSNVRDEVPIPNHSTDPCRRLGLPMAEECSRALDLLIRLKLMTKKLTSLYVTSETPSSSCQLQTLASSATKQPVSSTTRALLPS